MAITLRPLDRTNWGAVMAMEVHPQQAGFVAPNVRSLAQAYAEPEDRPLAIYADDTPVGLLVYEAVHTPGVYSLFRFMIGDVYQGKGYGRAALQAFIAHARNDPTAHAIELSYVPGNEHAARLYAAAGFVATGEEYEGEIVMRLTLR